MNTRKKENAEKGEGKEGKMNARKKMERDVCKEGKKYREK